jgi:hypothetical protein
VFVAAGVCVAAGVSAVAAGLTAGRCDRAGADCCDLSSFMILVVEMRHLLAIYHDHEKQRI